MKQKEYRKKVPIIDDRSSPQARALRLRKLRNMANLTRDQFCKNSNIAAATLKRWELAYYGGLPIDGAKKVIDCIANEGVICSLEWLLHEIGSYPIINPAFRKNQRPTESSFITKNYSVVDEENLIVNELLLFRQNHPNSIDLKVIDDGLFPKYKVGDYVAGIIMPTESLEHLLYQDCIVQLCDGQILLRNLRKGFSSNHYSLVCTNEQARVKEPLLQNVEIAIIAPILRYYKNIDQFLL